MLLRAASAEPLCIQLIVNAIFFQFEQRFIHRFAKRTVGWKDDTVVFLAKNCAYSLCFALSFMGCVVEENWRVIHDGIDFLFPECPISFFNLREFDRLYTTLTQIFGRGAALYAAGAFPRQIRRAV